jgi:hypothetical protein
MNGWMLGGSELFFSIIATTRRTTATTVQAAAGNVKNDLGARKKDSNVGAGKGRERSP